MKTELKKDFLSHRVEKTSGMSMEGPDYQAVLPEYGAPRLPDTEDVSGVRDDSFKWSNDRPFVMGWRPNIGTLVLVPQRGWGIIVQGNHQKGWTVEFKDYTTDVYACIDGDSGIPTVFEAYRTSNKWGEKFYCTKREVRKEFAPWLKEHGEIHFSPTVHDDKIRKEYNALHPYHGQIDFFENEKCVRTKYNAPHSKNGVVDFFENEKLVRTEYNAQHKRHNRIDFFEDGKRVRTEYNAQHPSHGYIVFPENNKLIRVEFSEDHKNHGDIQYYDSRKNLIRVEHRGEIRFYDLGKLFRIKYAKGHTFHGEVRHFEKDKLTKIEFPDGRSFVPEDKKRKLTEVIVLEE